MPGWDFAHVQDDVNQHILRMFEGTLFFSLDAVHMVIYNTLLWEALYLSSYLWAYELLCNLIINVPR